MVLGAAAAPRARAGDRRASSRRHRSSEPRAVHAHADRVVLRTPRAPRVGYVVPTAVPSLRCGGSSRVYPTYQSAASRRLYGQAFYYGSLPGAWVDYAYRAYAPDVLARRVTDGAYDYAYYAPAGPFGGYVGFRPLTVGFTIPAGRVAALAATVEASVEPSATASMPTSRVATGSAHADAWALLVDERPAEALARFARASREQPEAAEPQVGYALAWVLAGDRSSASWAMRRAFRADLVALASVEPPEPLRAPLRAAVASYHADLMAGPGRRAETGFLIAAISYLLRQPTEARNALTHAIDAGDRTRSARNLAALLDDRESAVP